VPEPGKRVGGECEESKDILGVVQAAPTMASQPVFLERCVVLLVQRGAKRPRVEKATASRTRIRRAVKGKRDLRGGGGMKGMKKSLPGVR